MQTFMVYKDFRKSADVLDARRRFNQVNEGMALVGAIEQGPVVLKHYSMGGPKKYLRGPVPANAPAGYVKVKTPWFNHPAAKMWWNYLPALKAYVNACILSVAHYRTHPNMTAQLYDLTDVAPMVYPWWLGLPALHYSHRSNLIRKDPEYYGRYGWKVEPDLPYYWPDPDPPGEVDSLF